MTVEFAADASKLPLIWLVRLLIPASFAVNAGILKLAILGLLASIIGHSFSIFLNFRGGKGVATAMGGLLAIMSPVLLTGILVWGVGFLISRMVALASILFALSLSVSAYFIYGIGDLRFATGLLLSVLIFIRHKSNVKRMLHGNENNFKT